MLTIDAHLDLSMNAMEWNRDLRRPLEEIREREQGMTDKPDRRNSTVSFDELR
ncbi:MAG TPA: peptidase M19, partial [Cyclobacteriaceae bacterium]